MPCSSAWWAGWWSKRAWTWCWRRLPELLQRNVQLAVLGSGAAEFEAGFAQAASDHRGRVAFHRGYSEGLAHRIEAGADVFLMPSRFEPCGLNQLYSLRYGTLPIVHDVGGLADTVVHASAANLADGTATGIVMEIWSRQPSLRRWMKASRCMRTRLSGANSCRLPWRRITVGRGARRNTGPCISGPSKDRRSKTRSFEGVALRHVAGFFAGWKTSACAVPTSRG